MKFISLILFLTTPIVTHAYDPIPPGGGTENDCHRDSSKRKGCGIREVLDAYLSDAATTKQATVQQYGPIEDWDTSLVTDMSRCKL